MSFFRRSLSFLLPLFFPSPTSSVPSFSVEVSRRRRVFCIFAISFFGCPLTRVAPLSPPLVPPPALVGIESLGLSVLSLCIFSCFCTNLQFSLQVAPSYPPMVFFGGAFKRILDSWRTPLCPFPAFSSDYESLGSPSRRSKLSVPAAGHFLFDFACISPLMAPLSPFAEIF